MYVHPLERENKNATGGCVNFSINSTIFNALVQAFYNDKLKYVLKETDSDCTVENSSACPYFFFQSPLHTGYRTVEAEEKKHFQECHIWTCPSEIWVGVFCCICTSV